MGRYPLIAIIKENENKANVIYSFGPDIHSCERYPQLYRRWSFKVLKNETNPDEAFVLLNDMPKEHVSLLYKCIHKVYVHVKENGGMENMNNIEFPEYLEFIV